VLDKFEGRMIDQWSDVIERAGEEVIEAKDTVALLNIPVAQMRADETSAPGN
jgi:hypothetical protein